jgi:hypothetical protein
MPLLNFQCDVKVENIFLTITAPQEDELSSAIQLVLQSNYNIASRTGKQTQGIGDGEAEAFCASPWSLSWSMVLV